MAKAISDVQGIISTLLGKELPIVVVHNASGRAPNSDVCYSVKMMYAADSQEIRSKFGAFFVGGKDRRPDHLKSISISNKVTPGTQIRIMILKLLAKRYETANPGSKDKVIGYEARPMIKINPPEGSSRRVLNYTYIEAIQKLNTSFTAAELRPIVAKAKIHFARCMRATFVVLSEDSVVPGNSRDRRDPASSAASVPPVPVQPQVPEVAPAQVPEADEADDNDGILDVSVSPSATASRKRLADAQLLPESQRSRR